MVETIMANVDKLAFSPVRRGDDITIVTQGDVPDWLHRFKVLGADLSGASCDLDYTDADGALVRTEKYLLLRAQIGDGISGGFSLDTGLTLKDMEFFWNQTISSIEWVPYRENAILCALATEMVPMTTLDLHEAVKLAPALPYGVEDPSVLDILWGARDWRTHNNKQMSYTKSALAGLMRQGHITRQRRRAYEYSLTD